MNIQDAVKEAGEGGKIERPGYRGHFLVKDGRLSHSNGNKGVHNISNFLATDWQVVKPKREFQVGDEIKLLKKFMDVGKDTVCEVTANAHGNTIKVRPKHWIYPKVEDIELITPAPEKETEVRPGPVQFFKKPLSLFDLKEGGFVEHHDYGVDRVEEEVYIETLVFKGKSFTVLTPKALLDKCLDPSGTRYRLMEAWYEGLKESK